MEIIIKFREFKGCNNILLFSINFYVRYNWGININKNL